MLSILDIIEDTTVDGPGFRTSIYAAGCPNRCPGCHNPESWDIDRGHWMSTDEILEKVLADDFADVTFSGGDPMYQPEGFAKLACAIKEKAVKIYGVIPDIHLKLCCATLYRPNYCNTSMYWWMENSNKNCGMKACASAEVKPTPDRRTGFTADRRGSGLQL